MDDTSPANTSPGDNSPANTNPADNSPEEPAEDHAPDHKDATEAVLVEPGERANLSDGLAREEPVESVEQPAKVMRIGSMVKQLLEEVRNAPLDEASRTRLREIHEQSVRELAGALSPDLAAELDRITLPFDEAAPSEAELRIAQAQLVGWLEGLFHGIQAALMAQQMAARAQLTEMRQPGLPPGRGPGDPSEARPGAYL